MANSNKFSPRCRSFTRFVPTCAIMLLISTTTMLGQTSALDSLLKRIAVAPDDTNKVNLYWEAGASVIYQHAPAAIPYFNHGMALAQKLQYHRGLERCNTGTALAFTFMGKYDSGLVYNNNAIYYARKVGDVSRLALVYLNRADSYTNLQQFSEALKNCDTAISYAELSGNKDRMARIYAILNYVYTAQQQYDQALASLDRSQALFEQVQNIQMVGQSHFNRALLFQKTDQPDKAIQSIQKAIRIADSIQNFQNLSSFTIVLAQLYHTQRNLTLADSVARISLRYALETGNRTQQAVVYDMFYTLNMSKKNYQQAIEEELKAYAIVQEDRDLLREKDVAANLADAYLKLGNTSLAYKYLQISKNLNDSLVKAQFNDETARLQTTLQVAQKDKEIQLLNKDKELQQQRSIASFAVAVFALLGIGLFVNRYRLRQRMKELELRNRIAADLHDEVGSSLSSIHMLSQVAAQQQQHDVAHKDILLRVSTNARETVEKMSDIVWMIKPGEKEGQGLVQRMERFAYEMCSSRNITCSLQDTETLHKLKMSMTQRRNCYLIFKEALNNAVKYSGTEKIDILVNLQNRQFTLTVKDYGKGFDPAVIVAGNGLDNMKSRAKEIGGQLTIDSMPGKGTTVLLTLNSLTT